MARLAVGSSWPVLVQLDRIRKRRDYTIRKAKPFGAAPVGQAVANAKAKTNGATDAVSVVPPDPVEA